MTLENLEVDELPLSERQQISGGDGPRPGLQAHGTADAEIVTFSGARFSDSFWWCRKTGKWRTAPSNARG